MKWCLLVLWDSLAYSCTTAWAIFPYSHVVEIDGCIRVVFANGYCCCAMARCAIFSHFNSLHSVSTANFPDISVLHPEDWGWFKINCCSLLINNTWRCMVETEWMTNIKPFVNKEQNIGRAQPGCTLQVGLWSNPSELFLCSFWNSFIGARLGQTESN